MVAPVQGLALTASGLARWPGWCRIPGWLGLWRTGRHARGSFDGEHGNGPCGGKQVTGPGIERSAPGGEPSIEDVSAVYVLVTISRTWKRSVDPELKAMRSILGKFRMLYPGATLLHGDCPEGDRDAAAMWAGWGLPTRAVPVTGQEWARYGRSAGLRRNARMVALRPVVCVALIAHKSRGATGCADLADEAGIMTMRFPGEELPGEMPSAVG